ncbi:CotH kinase family protein [Mycoplasmatota bacterium]|nr:CotH kinase family protein [Mycoplasmatota bacterium]
MVKKILMVCLLTFFSIALISCDEFNDILEQPSTEEPSEYVKEISTFDRLFDDIKYRKITISVEQDEWLKLDEALREHEMNFGNIKTDEYILADMIYEDEDGEVQIDHIGLRTRGNLSVTYLLDDNGDINMNNFKINFREDFDGLYPENDGRRGFDLKELDMKWNRNYDETYLTESYALNMMNHFDVYAAETTHFILSFVIDGEETVMGLYTGFEPIDDEFFETRLSKSEQDGDLYKSLWQQNGPATLETIYDSRAIGIRDVSSNYLPSYALKTNKDTADISDFTDFIDHINTLEGDAFEAYIETHFDVTSFLRLLAVNVFIGNPDDYRAMGNNYYMYQYAHNDMWTMIPYDFDHGLGQGWWEQNVYPNYTIGVDVYTWFNLNNAITDQTYTHPLSDKILANETYKDIYTTYLNDILEDEYFTETYFMEEFNALKEAFENTFDDALDHQEFGLRNVISYINEKRADVDQQING